MMTNEWNKNDDRLLQAVENGDPEKVASLLGKKGASATKQDSEGKTAVNVQQTALTILGKQLYIMQLHVVVFRQFNFCVNTNVQLTSKIWMETYLCCLQYKMVIRKSANTFWIMEQTSTPGIKMEGTAG
uniref:Uncharacterized protein n=1 Tax=Buteo japonicus TaxID=224669 RepID=A0A8C0B5L0_9AVES